MNEEYLGRLRQWLTTYVAGFLTGDTHYDENIILKRDHTERVCQEALYIARGLNLPENDVRLAEVMALFHDVGRFEQYAKYGTFSDPNSTNHAELSIEILDRHRVLQDLEDSQTELVKRAIGYHNRRELPENETERCLLFSRILRDADKLDIWRVFNDHYQGGGTLDSAALLFLPDTPGFSERICADLIGGNSAKYEDMNNLNDFRLLQLSWVYDLNFPPTLQRVKELEYVQRIRDVLPESEIIDSAFDRIKAHLDERTA